MRGSPLLVCAGVAVRTGRLLLARRRAGDRHGGLWEFPGGKVRSGETPAAALDREWREELGTGATVGPPVTFVWRDLPEGPLLLLFFRCQPLGEPRPLQCAAVDWFEPEAAAALPKPPADEEAWPRLMGALRSAGVFPPSGQAPLGPTPAVSQAR